MISTLLTTTILYTQSMSQQYYDNGPTSGVATYYGGNDAGGACGYADVPSSTFPFGYYAACGGTVFNDGYGCGECYEIKCLGPETPNPSCFCSATPTVIVSCMDQCPECSATHFDLNPKAMDQIVAPGLAGTCGRISTEIRRVPCNYNGNIKIRAKSGTSQYWYGLHIDDVAGYGSISTVQLGNSNSYSVTCDKSSSASFWICNGGNPLSLLLPLSVELTDSSGSILQCNACITNFNGGAEFDFGSNFGVNPVPTSSTTAPAPTTSTTVGSSTTSTTTTTSTTNGGGNQGYIIVSNHGSTQAYYLSFLLHNVDASACGDSISDVQILQNNAWRSYNQYYFEDGAGNLNTYGHRYAFDHTGVDFNQMGDISIKIITSNGREIFLWGIIKDLETTSSFTSAELICDGTLAPTPATPAPITKAPTPPTTAYPTAQTICIDKDTLDWRSYDNELKLNGNRFNMKGLSWFGFETGNYDLYGLDVHDIDYYFQWMSGHGFNAVRLPFSQAFMNTQSNQQKYLAAVRAAANEGIFIMADFHSQAAGAYTEGFHGLNQASAIATWETVADLLKDEWNVFIADIFNEPHDVSNSEWGNWVQFTEDAARAIWAKGVNWLVAVEGTNWQCNTINCAWGENLEGVGNTGITFSETTYGNNRFVFSPHVYGADVTGNSYSEAGWQSHWGYLFDGSYPSNVAASVIGEFGTTYVGGMVNWLDDLIQYLIDIDQRNTFYWCLNPNSGDTGGLLKSDWTIEEADKLNALHILQPNPSVVTYDNVAQTVCVAFEGGVVSTSTSTTTTPAPTTTTTTTTTPSPTTTTPAPITTTTTTTTPAPTTTTTSTTTPSPTTTTSTTTTTTTTPSPTTTTTSTTTPEPTTTTTTPAPTTTTNTPPPTVRPTATPAHPTTTTTSTTTPEPTTTNTNPPTTRPTGTPAHSTTTTTTTSTTPEPTTTITLAPTTTTVPPPTTTTSITPPPTTRPTATPAHSTTTTTSTTPEPTTTTTTNTPPPTTRPTATPAHTTTTTTTTTTPAPTTTTTTSTTPSTSSGNTIIISNWMTTQPYYLTFTISNINACIENIKTVQILVNNEYRNADQYIYEEITRNPATYVHRFAFLYKHNLRFDQILPITLRIVTRNGYITLPQIINDFNTDSVFISSKTCDNVDDGDDDGDDDDDTIDDIDDGDVTTLTIVNCPGSNPWWYSAKPLDIPNNVQITSFEMRDSSGNNEWISYSRYDPHNGCYIFDSGNRPYVLPLDFKITTDNQQIETADVITSFTDYSYGNMAENFKNDGSDLYITDENKNNNGLNMVSIVMIIISIMAIICIVIGIVIYYKNKGNKGYSASNKNKAVDSIQMHVNTNDAQHVSPIPDDGDDSGSIEGNEQTGIVPAYVE